MTFFIPEQKSFLNYIIATFIAVVLLASISVIWAYNRSVNLEHEISAAELSIRKIETDKAQLQDKISTLLSDAALKKLSTGRNLVEEKNPRYVKIESIPSSELASSQK